MRDYMIRICLRPLIYYVTSIHDFNLLSIVRQLRTGELYQEEKGYGRNSKLSSHKDKLIDKSTDG